MTESISATPSFAPVYEELNRRKAVVYVHPLTPNCCNDVVPGIPPGSIEYATDSTRTMAHLVFSGTSQKYPDIRWIFSHSRRHAAVPHRALRAPAAGAEARAPAERAHAGIPEVLLRAGAGQHQGAASALFEMVTASQVLYGTDYPYRDGAEVNDGIAEWKFAAADLRSIENETAKRLLPKLKTA